jgi:hypothetical protein
MSGVDWNRFIRWGHPAHFRRVDRQNTAGVPRHPTVLTVPIDSWNAASRCSSRWGFSTRAKISSWSRRFVCRLKLMKYGMTCDQFLTRIYAAIMSARCKMRSEIRQYRKCLT